MMDILILRALALQQMGDIDQALLAIGKAFTLAEPEGYQRIFVDEGEPMARLLYQALSRGIAPAYASQLLDVIVKESEMIRPADMAKSSDLIEPLSERELEVLRLIAEGLTNQEVASRLYISLSTVKGHAANIFGKLGVNNRTQAVARARSLGLLVF